MMYHQLTSDERYTISKLRIAGYGAGRIGEIMGRHRSTIHREFERNRKLPLIPDT
jgi:IS30 family transposase